MIRNFFILVTLSLTFCMNAYAEDVNQNDSKEHAVLGFKQLIGEDILEAYENKTMEGIYADYVLSVQADLPPVTFTETHHDNATTTYIHAVKQTSQP